jgi:hypothetical protein
MNGATLCRTMLSACGRDPPVVSACGREKKEKKIKAATFCPIAF